MAKANLKSLGTWTTVWSVLLVISFFLAWPITIFVGLISLYVHVKYWLEKSRVENDKAIRRALDERGPTLAELSRAQEEAEEALYRDSKDAPQVDIPQPGNWRKPRR